MIELRWLQRKVECKVSCNPGAYGAQMVDGYKIIEVLQYRNKGEIDVWQDVPIVQEEKTND